MAALMGTKEQQRTLYKKIWYNSHLCGYYTIGGTDRKVKLSKTCRSFVGQLAAVTSARALSRVSYTELPTRPTCTPPSWKA